MIPRLIFGDRELVAVPAVHYRALFAHMVHQACRDPATRPDAIAVELSHDAVSALINWFQELGVGSGRSGQLPCMLGLVTSQCRIHPRHKEAAIRLQEQYGLPLDQIHPDVLRRELDFCPVSLLCISTTDSMVEAIRSALELGIPVYGIDLGQVANVERGQPALLDPIFARNNLVSYIERNEFRREHPREEVVDARRERVMAARLKRLLGEHRRVLFSGGLGHWRSLRRLMANAAIAPASEPSRSEGARFLRVVVAPSLAIRQMDLFPDLTDRYETLRQLPVSEAEQLLDLRAFYRDKLTAALVCCEPSEREAGFAFARYVTNLALIHQRLVPDLFMTLHAATVMVSPAFASRLVESFVTKARPWARPDDFPGLPSLREIQSSSTESHPANSGCRVRLESSGFRTLPFHLAPFGDREDRASGWLLPSPIDPPEFGTDAEGREPQGLCWVWPPCESLLYGTAYQAAEIMERVNRREPSPQPFAGSLEEGVDVKATLRALVRGERRIQVKIKSVRTAAAAIADDPDEPTVFVFQCERSVTAGHWELFLACAGEDIRSFVHDTGRLDEVLARRGDVFVASVPFCAVVQPDKSLGRHVPLLRYLYGVVVFGNPCLNPRQAARWLESSRYNRCPILRRRSVNSLFEHYRREHKLTLHPDRWVSSLVRLAFPFAKQRVTVLLPPGQSIPGPVFREAAARDLRLEPVPLSHFPNSHVKAMRHQYLVRPRDVDALEFPPELETAFGQAPTAHLNLLPARIRAQLERGTGPGPQ